MLKAACQCLKHTGQQNPHASSSLLRLHQVANQVQGNDLSNHKVMWHQYGTQLGLENCWSWFRLPFSRTSLHKNHDLMRPLAVAHSTQAFQSYTEMKSDLGSFGASSGFATKRKWPENTNTHTHTLDHTPLTRQI